MRILSFHPGCHDASAAVFEDYNLVAAVEEERLTRRKGSGDGVPWLAIDEVLRIAGWARKDVEVMVATRSFFPPRYFRYPLHKELGYRVRRWLGTDKPMRDLMVHCQLERNGNASEIFRVEEFLGENGFNHIPLSFSNHHEAHALTSLFFTDWNDALLYTADGVGDNVSYSIRSLKDGRLDCHFGDDRWLLQRGPARSSIAWAYGYATQECGFSMFRHEGKLTGLAAHGEPKLADDIARHFWIDDNGMIAAHFEDDKAISKTMRQICRGQTRETIAASIQKVTEDLMLATVQFWLQKCGTRNLGLGGGLFSNVRLNRLLAERCPLDEIFIFPAMGDSGIAAGAALGYLLKRDGLKNWLGRRCRLEDVYLGFDYDDQIDATLSQAQGVRTLGGSPAKTATELLIAGKVGATYIGRMEFGPRALGARSILARPDVVSINEELNHRLDRSEFMPFAPFVLEEDCEKVFEITPVNRYAARFMTVTCAVRPEWHARIPAVIHVDGTARPQILREQENPLYAEILRRFRAATGLPVLVNTSFNVHEEPIVNRPEECLKALLDGRVDFIVTKQAVYSTSSLG